MKDARILAVLLVTLATGLPVMGQNLLPSSLTTPAANNSGAAQDYIQFDGNSYPGANLICFSAGCGGEFQATISPGPLAPTAQVPKVTVPVTVWCVDYQLNVTTGSQYAADVSLLSNITHPTDTSVQYGTLPNNNAKWTNPLTSDLPTGVAAGGIGPTVDGGAPSTAAYRFTLAAALVSQYVSNPGTPGFLNGGLAENTAIQEAIWYLTSNTTNGTDSAFPFGSLTANVNDVNNYAYWLNKVLTPNNSLVANLDLTRWAVISGPIGPDGTVSPANVGGYNSYQTFIAEVTPEPSFYGILGASLVGLFAARRASKRKNA